MFNFDDLPEDDPDEDYPAASADDKVGNAAQQEAEGLLPIRVWAVSDVHTDMKENMAALTDWPRCPDDVLILAGDVSNDLKVLRATLVIACDRFGHVFFCPGNHDLWLHKEDGCSDSIAKLRKIEAICQELGVHTSMGVVGGVTIVPLHSWYHAGFDADPDVLDESLAPVDKVMMDFHVCKWPEGLTAHDGSDSIAKFMDSLNDEALAGTTRCAVRRGGPVISFSHFLPRPDLLPEKRLLFYPPLPKAAGSLLLGDRVGKLAPDLHVFGHTHYAWAQELGGVRYVQACLAYPRERDERPFSVKCSDKSRDGRRSCRHSWSMTGESSQRTEDSGLSITRCTSETRKT
jgi:predicted phosphohydrolase